MSALKLVALLLSCSNALSWSWGLAVMAQRGKDIVQGDPAVKVGASVFVESKYAALGGAKRVAVMSNPSSLLPDSPSLMHIVDKMNEDRASSNVALVFGPEHGFRGDQQAGSGGPKKYTDPQLSLIHI